jgi:hypothetical protein
MNQTNYSAASFSMQTTGVELLTVRQYADGLVIWGGWGTGGPQPWDEDTPWWQVTKRFLSRIDIVVPARPKDLNVQ